VVDDVQQSLETTSYNNDIDELSVDAIEKIIHNYSVILDLSYCINMASAAIFLQKEYVIIGVDEDAMENHIDCIEKCLLNSPKYHTSQELERYIGIFQKKSKKTD
jgi:hypothetical protein